ncbi:MAG TPA: hypothetical protein PKM48_13305 [Parvularculaceae bacterium]|nr:hypothetical protein [Parvularculaceae bacterium]HNS86480.1 hypothetical protein [Parvularculaceae bacterium]
MAEIIDLNTVKTSELLSLYSQFNEELRRREIVRSGNNPTGDLAETLFCRAFHWRQEKNSKRGYDAIDADNKRNQIKARRLHRRNKSRQLSGLRDLSNDQFDFLAGVLFDESYRIQRAAIIPKGVVQSRSKYIAHTNSNRFLLHDNVWLENGVIDVTERLKNEMALLDTV